MDKILPLSGRGEEITYKVVGDTRRATWGGTPFRLPDSTIDGILKKFFIEVDKWYPLGADEESPMSGGLGEFLQSEYKDLSSRHASAVAAIMHHEGLIEFKDGRPILLRKMKR